jgi:hypothetical protein
MRFLQRARSWHRIWKLVKTANRGTMTGAAMLQRRNGEIKGQAWVKLQPTGDNDGPSEDWVTEYERPMEDLRKPEDGTLAL